MPFPNEDTQFKPGKSGNPAGKPKGAVHLSTHIQNALNDPDFELKLEDGTLTKEMPIKAIIKTAILKSVGGDTRAMEWLAKHGYGEKMEITGGVNPVRVLLQGYGLLDDDEGSDDRKIDEPVSGSPEV